MGSDIHVHVEQQDLDGSWQHTRWPAEVPDYVGAGPFTRRHYGVFGFLGLCSRNYSRVPAVAQLRGLPPDISRETRRDAHAWRADGHSHSWVSVQELADVDYSQTFEDLRGDGGVTTEPGCGEMTTLRAFLGDPFFADLAALTAMNQVRSTRMVFWFDC
jgi:hypothetical protein